MTKKPSFWQNSTFFTNIVSCKNIAIIARLTFRYLFCKTIYLRPYYTLSSSDHLIRSKALLCWHCFKVCEQVIVSESNQIRSIIRVFWHPFHPFVTPFSSICDTVHCLSTFFFLSGRFFAIFSTSISHEMIAIHCLVFFKVVGEHNTIRVSKYRAITCPPHCWIFTRFGRGSPGATHSVDYRFNSSIVMNASFVNSYMPT